MGCPDLGGAGSCVPEMVSREPRFRMSTFSERTAPSRLPFLTITATYLHSFSSLVSYLLISLFLPNIDRQPQPSGTYAPTKPRRY